MHQTTIIILLLERIFFTNYLSTTSRKYIHVNSLPLDLYLPVILCISQTNLQTQRDRHCMS